MSPQQESSAIPREYGPRFLELAVLHNPKLLSAKELNRIRPPYSRGTSIEWQEIGSNEEETHGENSERFFFIREAILKALLQKHRWALVWAIWGERQLSSKQMELWREIRNAHLPYAAWCRAARAL
jgi:hypothetical protein